MCGWRVAHSGVVPGIDCALGGQVAVEVQTEDRLRLVRALAEVDGSVRERDRGPGTKLHELPLLWHCIGGLLCNLAVFESWPYLCAPSHVRTHAHVKQRGRLAGEAFDRNALLLRPVWYHTCLNCCHAVPGASSPFLS